MIGRFYRFPDLPWELRDMIWNFALRPSVPGVHIFKAYNKKTEDGVDKNTDVFNLDERSNIRLAAPQSKKSSITRNRNNPSTYLIDGGLWTACKESRLVMKRNFNCQKWTSSLEGGMPFGSDWLEVRMDMPDTSYFAHHNGDPHYFTVFPHKDLFIIRPRNLETIDWSKLPRDVQVGSWIRGFGGIQNIALEYNPDWGYDIEENIVKMAMDAGWACDGVNIWIVDYTLRRRDSAAVGQKPTCREDENVAFHLNGRRLIPVNLYRDEGWIEIEKVNGKYIERVSGMSSIELVKHVRDEIWERCDEFEIISSLMVFVGVLACDST